MQSKTERNRKAKLHQRVYRKTHADKVLEYNRKTIKERSNRNKARAMMKKKMGASAVKGMDVHHKDGQPMHNGMRNLSLKKKHHSGGRKGRM